MDEIVSFGHVLRKYRRARDLTQEELARRAYCALTTIKKVEAHERRPSRELAERLAQVLEVPEADVPAFLRLARGLRPDAAPPLPVLAPALTPHEVGAEDLSGREARGYALRERLGIGGFGAVYRAVQSSIGREVAVKIILPRYANHPDFIRRFEAEAQFVARLEHPYIVPLYDYWREPNSACLVMRYMRGSSLAAALGAGPLGPGAALQVLEQIGAALEIAHRAGVVHRDLKPANVLRDAEGNAYLADFGIAKDLGNADVDSQTQAGAIVGSPDYLSPEQIADEPITPRTDIYSLGVMLYELLTGAKPFQTRTPAELLRLHLTTPLPSLRERRPELPEVFDAVIQCATAKRPADRYPNVASLVLAFREMVSGPAQAISRLDAEPEGDVTIDAERRTVVLDVPVENPYKGLRAFGEADAADFFGRDALVGRLLERMSEPGAGDEGLGAGKVALEASVASSPQAPARDARFLAVVGPSGSGKSSVVRAGLIPALRQGGLPGSEQWFIADLIPGAHPLEELETALLRVAVNPPASLLEQLQADERGLLRAIKRVLPADTEVELVLVIDQFEELFTLVADEASRTHLLDNLHTIVTDPHSRARVVVTLRADFYDRPLLYSDFGELMQQRTEVVLPLTPEELERAIVTPAERAGLALEPGLVAAIIRDVGQQPGMLPLLQYALTELFERRAGRSLTLSAYQASGGVLGALARRADELYVGLDAVGQAAARQLFLRLITPGEGVEDTRRRVRQSEIRDWRLEIEGGDIISNLQSPISTVLDLYGRYRLLTFDHDPMTREPTVEVAHEALIRTWGRLRGWLDTSREELRVQRRLLAAAAEWANAGRDTSFLATGARLAQFEGLASSDPSERGLALNAAELTYLEASLAAREEQHAQEEAARQRELAQAQALAAEQQHRAEAERQRAEEQTGANRRLRWRAIALAVLAVLALGAAVFAGVQQQQANNHAAAALDAQARAEHEARVATARELAAAAISNLDLDPERSILLALHAVSTTYSADKTMTTEAEDALHQAVQTSRIQLTLTGHTDKVTDVTFSPDGTRLVTASEANALVWDAATGQLLITLSSSTGQINTIAFNGDGTRIATGTSDGRTIVWDAATGKRLLTLPVYSMAVFDVAFSPDGTRLATASWDHTVKVWDVATGRELLTMRHQDTVTSVAFSPDGTRLATASWDKTAIVWDATSGEKLLSLSHPDLVLSITFSPDGKRLATTSQSQTVTVWDVASAAMVFSYDTAGAWGGVTFDPRGTRLATGSAGGPVEVRDGATGGELIALRGHTDAVTSVAFSPDGTRLATASWDHTVKVWDVSTVRTSHVQGIILSRDWTRLATQSRGWIVQVWDAPTGRDLLTLPGPIDGFTTMVFSPDGTRLATVSGRTANIWDAATGRELLTLSGHSDDIEDITFSPDGTRLATTSRDKTAKIWDAASGRLLRTLSGYVNWVRGIAFSPDGARLATATHDDSYGDVAVVIVWDVASGNRLLSLSGHAGEVKSVAFSPDGTRLATASTDHTAKVWDAATGRELLTLPGHTNRVTSLAFSPDGTHLATGSEDHTVKVWDAATGRELLTLTHIASAGIHSFSPDGTRLATASEDGLHIYPLRNEDLLALARTRVTRSLTAAECQKYLHVEQCPPAP